MAKEPAGLTTKEAADACGVNTRTVKRWLTEGKLPNAKRVGPGKNAPWRFPLADFIALGKVTKPESQSAADQREARDVDRLGSAVPGESPEVLKVKIEGLEKLIAQLEQNNADLRSSMKMLGSGGEVESRRTGWFGRRKTTKSAGD